MQDIRADSNKVIDKLLFKIAQLEKNNAILTVQLEELLEIKNKMDTIERGSLK
jgi:hypothetical protein